MNRIITKTYTLEDGRAFTVTFAVRACSEITDELLAVVRCTGKDWSACCNCRLNSGCMLKYSRYPGHYTVFKTSFKDALLRIKTFFQNLNPQNHE